jgi:hypothetical protein
MIGAGGHCRAGFRKELLSLVSSDRVEYNFHRFCRHPNHRKKSRRGFAAGRSSRWGRILSPDVMPERVNPTVG